MSWKLFVSILAIAAQLLFVADCERFGADEKTTLAAIRLPVQRFVMYFMRSIAMTTNAIDLKEANFISNESQINSSQYYLNDFLFFGSARNSGSAS